MLEQIRAQWRLIVVGIALIALAAGALAAGVAVLAQGDDTSRQPVTLSTPAGGNEAQATPPAASAASEASAGVPQPQGQPTPRPPQGATYHTVRSGETLGKIAAAYGVTTAAVVNANGLSNPNLIYVGQRLMIPAR
jgi:LysM repeat protein